MRVAAVPVCTNVSNQNSDITAVKPLSELCDLSKVLTAEADKAPRTDEAAKTDETTSSDETVEKKKELTEKEIAARNGVMSIMISQFRIQAMLGDKTDPSSPMYTPEW
ncbi:hypothetical protein C3432_01875 [Citrobacter amalonaticus]|uniref:Uncharacterized protein n=1 Tax=Citrobacter amalonaticus TaxID=35703 RepID=A0A2S4S2J9_CITAM|nr:hypothetical protein [Citrobacter amalonaticus]POT59495.1 hypothetical protein C3432_01875 [Citrobacter amalonaticus]POT77625.1 hypothetical protein C3436_09545 [Citrobacter amalonaticus]POU68077.1 hypothetical protein C3430_03080 [Citrobacter amalonaticus]POV07681.1 hypothetical protein C3424_03090 [Citrobacter amalonaticus]